MLVRCTTNLTRSIRWQSKIFKKDLLKKLHEVFIKPSLIVDLQNKSQEIKSFKYGSVI